MGEYGDIKVEHKRWKEEMNNDQQYEHLPSEKKDPLFVLLLLISTVVKTFQPANILRRIFNHQGFICKVHIQLLCQKNQQQHLRCEKEDKIRSHIFIYMLFIL